MPPKLVDTPSGSIRLTPTSLGGRVRRRISPFRASSTSSGSLASKTKTPSRAPFGSRRLRTRRSRSSTNAGAVTWSCPGVRRTSSAIGLSVKGGSAGRTRPPQLSPCPPPPGGTLQVATPGRPGEAGGREGAAGAAGAGGAGRGAWGALCCLKNRVRITAQLR
jgi:hypothetical protein